MGIQIRAQGVNGFADAEDINEAERRMSEYRGTTVDYTTRETPGGSVGEVYAEVPDRVLDIGEIDAIMGVFEDVTGVTLERRSKWDIKCE